MAARAIPVVLTEDDHTFSLDEKALEEILLDPRVRDEKVVVVSVAGAYRKGKSFLLNFFLRYLHAKGAPNWLGDLDAPLTGFSWKGGSERNTSGILLWSEPFDVSLPSGEKVCVLLMDTQGAFDSQSTVKECATVFVLSTMISSVQVYNLQGNIQEDDLQHLEHLQFLVRDWQYPYEHEFGSSGGDELLKKRLQIVDGQHEEHANLRKLIGNCFDHIGCFLMPHPGLEVATHPDFDGRLADIDEKFRAQVKEFVSTLLCPENLVVKAINGSMLTGQELMRYFKSYVEVFHGNELPEPKTIMQATADANNETAKARAKELYIKEMDKVCGGYTSYIDSEILRIGHRRCLAEAMELFNSIPKMGGEEYSNKYEAELKDEIKSYFDHLVKQNDAKNIIFQIAVGICSYAVTIVSMPFQLELLILDSFNRRIRDGNDHEQMPWRQRLGTRVDSIQTVVSNGLRAVWRFFFP